MSNFSFEGNNPNRVPKYNYPSKISEVLKQTVKDELRSASDIGLFSLSQLRAKLNQRDREIDLSFDTEFYDKNNKRAYLSGSEKIISLTFLPTEFINEFGERDETPRLDLEICAVGVAVQKSMVKTELINQKGAIKEYISQPDYPVSISGVLIGYFIKPTSQNPMAAKPIEDMKTLLQICEAKISVKVASDTLNLYGITRLSIESLNMPQELSDINIQKFSISAYSDREDLVIL